MGNFMMVRERGFRERKRMAKANEILTIIELAGYLRIPRATAYKLAQQGRIPCQKVGRHWRFRKEAVDRWLESEDSRPKA